MLSAAETYPAIDAVDYYDRDAARFAERYDSVSFGEVHSAIAQFLPPSDGAVLDVGAGSGRDARALAAMGFSVTAIEPAADLRRAASRQPNGEKVRWLDDRLPDLTQLADEKFAFILCSAVMMLLPPADLAASMSRMAGLLEPGGRLAMSVRNAVPAEPAGLVHAHSSAQIRAAAAAAGLDPIFERTLPDALGRSPYTWRSFVFERARRPR